MSETISFDVDAGLKRSFEQLCVDVGMNLKTALSAIMEQSVRENRFPVKLEGNPICEEELTTSVPGEIITEEELRRRVEEVEAGFVVQVTMEELEALEDEEPGGPVFQRIEQRRKEMQARKRAWKEARDHA